MHSTDRQLRQITCLGNGLSFFSHTEMLSEFQLGAFALQDSVRKTAPGHSSPEGTEDISLRVGFRVSYIIGIYALVGNLADAWGVR